MKKTKNGKRKLKSGGRKILPSPSIYFRLFLVFVSVIFAANCAQKMGVQPNHRPFEKNDFFDDKQLARKPVEGTIESGWTRTNRRITTDESFDKNSNELPFPLSEEVLERGRERFEINCSVCHGLTGDGSGRVAQRGFSKPPTYHDDRLRNAPLGHFYDVITNGFGAMGSYAAQVEPEDRWAIAAYIRALQLSQNASVADVPPEKLKELEEKK